MVESKTAADALAEIERVCGLLVVKTDECSRKLAAFYAYYVDGEGEAPAAADQPEMVLNPKVNGTNALFKRLRTALGCFMPGQMPDGGVRALDAFIASATAFVKMLEDFCRCESLNVSYICECDIFNYMTQHTVVELTPEMHRANLKAKFKALKTSFYGNAMKGYAIATEVMASSPYRCVPKVRYTYESVMARLRSAQAKPAPQEVVVVGVSRGVSLATREPARKVREISFELAETLLKALAEQKSLADRSVGKRTLMRWEAGESEPKAGYTAACRDSLAAFTAWAEVYLAEERSRLNADRAVSYCDTWRKHRP